MISSVRTKKINRVLQIDELLPGVLYTGTNLYDESIVFSICKIMGKFAYVLLAVEDDLDNVEVFYPYDATDPTDHEYVFGITDIRQFDGTVTLQNDE